MSRKSKKPQSGMMNDAQFGHYEYLLANLALSRFKWENLPDELDPRYLEWTLYTNALAVFFHDEEYNRYFAQECTPSGQINMTHNPTRFLAYGPGGFNRQLKWTPTAETTECIPIWANFMRYPFQRTIWIYARRLTDIDRTVDVNLHANKTPVLIRCDEEQKLTLSNFYKQYSGNEPVIMGYKTFGNEAPLEVVQTGADYLVDKLLLDKTKVLNEILTFLGIDNANQDKKERLVEDEVSANNGQIEMMRLSELNGRRLAAKQINEKYGLDVQVNFNHDTASENDAFVNSIPDLLGNEGGEL